MHRRSVKVKGKGKGKGEGKTKGKGKGKGRSEASKLEGRDPVSVKRRNESKRERKSKQTSEVGRGFISRSTTLSHQRLV